MQTTSRVGLIGYGVIGRAVAQMIRAGQAGSAELCGILVRDITKGRSESLRDIPFVDQTAQLLGLRPTVVVDAAGGQALAQSAESVLSQGIDIYTVSAAALANPELVARLSAAARHGGSRLRLVSGSIAGLDAISAAAVLGLDEVVHTVRKPPIALLPPEDAVRVNASGTPDVIFSGSAREAALRYPNNVNVVAAVGLAGLGMDNTVVRVIADPGVDFNTHEVEARGTFGRLTIRLENRPSPENPRTSPLAAASIIRALNSLTATIVIST